MTEQQKANWDTILFYLVDPMYADVPKIYDSKEGYGWIGAWPDRISITCDSNVYEVLGKATKMAESIKSRKRISVR